MCKSGATATGMDQLAENKKDGENGATDATVSEQQK